MDDVIRANQPITALARMANRHRLTRAEFVCVLGVPRRTLQRRRGDNRLSTRESDRLCSAAAVLKSAPAYWIRRPHVDLDGQRPLDLLNSDKGCRVASELIGAQIR